MREITSTPPPNESASSIASPIISMLGNLHAVVIGPGLGRDKLMQDTVAAVITAAREKDMPLVLDADALWLIQSQPDLVRGYKECVLTPNVVEFGRLAKAIGIDPDELPDSGEGGCKKLAAALGGVCIVRKGAVDWISGWRKVYHEGIWEVEGDLGRRETLMLAAFGGSAITRECSRLAFGKHGRALQASDLTEEVPVAFETLIGEKEASKL